MGYNELARIESIYGCVPEYFRCQMEEDRYEPTEAEIEGSEREMEAYYAEIELLNGTPSDFVKQLVDEWESIKPDSRNYYACQDWIKSRKLDITSKVAEHYNVSVDEDRDTFYNVPENKFAISVEYADSCYIKTKNLGNLSLEQFKDVFRDLHFAGLYPTMRHNGRCVSNCSLGNILRNYVRD